MEQTTILLFIQFDAWIESHEQYPYYQYYAEYDKVLCGEKDITELVRQYPDIELAIEEELQREYPKTGKNLRTNFCLDVPVSMFNVQCSMIIDN